MNETEVREKIVIPWLTHIGIDISNVSMEYGFTIRLGKNVYNSKTHNETNKIIGRADYLVKTNTNINLFVIEVKGKTIALTEEDKAQGISYARLINEGNVPPFVILTNGRETKIYDTLTKVELKYIENISEHPFLKNGFKIDVDLALRTEALQYLITFSEDNLLLFCKNQVKKNLELLSSEDENSGKKYIPKLYIDREEEKEKLNKLIIDTDISSKVILVTGIPQVGKTSFICNNLEVYLSKNVPCLFYPAVGLKTGILKALEEDFSWGFSKEFDIKIILQKLSKILSTLNKPLLIFIDGLNEIDQEKAYLISEDCEKLQIANIKIIISATRYSLAQTLFQRDYETYFSNQINLTLNECKIFKHKELAKIKEKYIIQIKEFNNRQVKSAIEKHAEVYKVELNENHLYNSTILSNPFYLRGIFEYYKSKILPVEFDTSEIIHNNLQRKLLRAGYSEMSSIILINKINQELFNNGAPIIEVHNLNIKSTELNRLIECAIILETHNNFENYSIDYYYSRERDFAIAYYLRKWNTLFLNTNENIILNELIVTYKTNVGREALRWFFSTKNHKNHLKHSFEILEHLGITTFNDVFIDSILKQEFTNEYDKQWILKIVGKIVGIDKFEISNEIFDDKKKLGEVVVFIYKLILANDITFQNITENQLVLFKKLLECEAYEDDSLEFDSYSKMLLENDNYKEIYTEILFFDKNDLIIERVALIMASSSTEIFMDTINKLIEDNISFVAEKKELLISAINLLENEAIMNDTYCDPGNIDGYELDELMYNLYQYNNTYSALLKLYDDENIGSYFRNIIGDYEKQIIYLYKKNVQDLATAKRMEIIEILGNHYLFDYEDEFTEKQKHNPLQLYLPFNEEFILLNKQIASKYFNTN